MATFTLRKEGDTNNPQLAVPYGYQVTAGQLAYYDQVSGKTVLIALLGEGEMEGCSRVYYNGTLIPEFVGGNSGARNWKFHPGTYTSKSIYKTFTASAGNATITSNNHGFTNGTQVRLTTTSSLPTGFSVDLLTYTVANATTNTFQLTLGGNTITPSSAGEGVHRAYLANTGYGDPIQGRPELIPNLEFTFSGIAYIELVVPADFVEEDADPTKLMVMVKGRRMYDYNLVGGAGWTLIPGTSVYRSPAKIFSNNNALIAADLLTTFSKIPDERINWETLVAFKERCDEVIAWGASGSGWVAEYYNDIALTQHAITRNEATVNFIWSTYNTPPTTTGAYFSARFKSKIKPPTTGSYTFYIRHDDGVRVKFNGVTVIDQWATWGQTHTYTTSLTANVEVDVEIEYFQANAGPLGPTNEAYCQFDWSGPGILRNPVPASVTTPASRNQKRFSADVVFPAPTDVVAALELVMLRAPGCTWQDVAGSDGKSRVTFYTTPNRPVVHRFTYDPTQTIVKSNIVADSFSAWRKPPEDKPNFLRFSFRDKEQEFFEKAYAYADRPLSRDEADQLVDPGIIELGVCDQSLADRIAESQMRTMTDLDVFVSVQGQAGAFHVAKGDVVEIAHDVPGWPESAPVKFMVIGETFEPSMQTADERSFDLQIYNPAYYSDTDHGPIQLIVPTILPNISLPPPPATGLTLTESSRSYPDGTILPIINGSVTVAEHPFKQQVQIWIQRGQTGDYIPANVPALIHDPATSSGLSLPFTVDAPIGTHNIRAVTATLGGNHLTPLTVHIWDDVTIVGSTANAPTAPATLNKTYTNGAIVWSWTASTDDLYVDYYELRDANTGTVIFRGKALSFVEPYVSGTVERRVFAHTVGGYSSTGAYNSFTLSAPLGVADYDFTLAGDWLRHSWTPRPANEEVVKYEISANSNFAIVLWAGLASAWQESILGNYGSRTFNRYIRAVNQYGAPGPASALVTKTFSAPAAPTVAVDDGYPSSVVITITPPGGLNTDAVKRTVVEVSTNSGFTAVYETLAYDGITNTATIQGRSNVGTNGNVYIRARYEDAFGAGANSTGLNYQFVQFTSTDIGNGAVGTAQIAASAITAALLANDVSTVHSVSSLPALPDAAYPSGRVVSLTTDGRLYRNNAGTWVAISVAAGDLVGTISANQLNPAVGIINSVGTLPTLPDSNYPSGRVVFLSTDGQLYRNNSGTWTAAVPTSGLTGFIQAAQIQANSITASQIAANTITAGQIAANTITASQIAANTITANQIAANTITASQIAANTITASQIASRTITADRIVLGAITDSEIDPASGLMRNVRGRINSPISGGGNIGWSAGGVLTWSVRFIALPTPLSSSGYFDFVQPGSGVTIGTWQALYFRTQIGSGSAVGTTNISPSASANGWFLMDYNSPVQTPIGYSDWLLAWRNSDDNALHLFDGRVLQPGMTITQANFLPNGSVVANHMTANSITAGAIAANAVVAGNIAAGAVTAATISAGAVTTAAILAGAVTADKISANVGDFGIVLGNAVVSKDYTRYSIDIDHVEQAYWVNKVNLNVGIYGGVAHSGTAGSWNSKAVSARGIVRGEGYIETTLDADSMTASDKAFGLTYERINDSWTDITAGFMIDSAGEIYHIRFGVQTTTGLFAAEGTVLRVQLKVVSGNMNFQWFVNDMDNPVAQFRADLDGGQAYYQQRVRYSMRGVVALGEAEAAMPPIYLFGRIADGFRSSPRANLLTPIGTYTATRRSDGDWDVPGGTTLDFRTAETLTRGDGFFELQSPPGGGGWRFSLRRADNDVEQFWVRQSSDGYVYAGTISVSEVQLVGQPYNPSPGATWAYRVGIEDGIYVVRINGQDPPFFIGSAAANYPLRGAVYSNPSFATTVPGNLHIYQMQSEGTGWKLHPQQGSNLVGQGEFNEGIVIRNMALTEAFAKAGGSITRDGLYKGRDIGVLDDDAFEDITFNKIKVLDNDPDVFVSLNFDTTIAESNLSNTDSVTMARVTVRNKFNEQVYKTERAWHKRGIVLEGFYPRDYADPLEEAVYTIEIFNVYGFSKKFYYSAAAWVTDKNGSWVNKSQVAPANWISRSDVVTNLVANPVTNKAVALTWTKASITITDQDLYYRPVGTTTWTHHTDLNTTESAINIGGLTPNTAYEFVITTNNGSYMNSNIARVRTLPTSTAAAAFVGPSGLSASSPDDDTVDLVWTNGTTGANIVTRVYESTDNVTFTQIATPASGVTTYQRTGRNPETVYYYKVSHYNSSTVEESDFSSVVSVTTKAVYNPAAPSSLAAYSTTQFSISLSYLNPSNLSITVHYGLTPALGSTVAGGLTNKTVTGLMSGTEYYFKVVNSAGESAIISEATEEYIPPEPDPDCVTLDALIPVWIGETVEYKSAKNVLMTDTIINGRGTPSRLAGIRKGWTSRVYTIVTSLGKEVECSPSHPILTFLGDDVGKKARELSVGDEVLVYHGGEMMIDKIESIEYLDARTPVIIFSMLNEEHTYIAGDIACHNRKIYNL